MKEHDYKMNLMSTYGGITVNNGQKEPKIMYKYNNGAMNTTTLRYTKQFLNQFLYHYDIDDHNNICQSSPSIE